MTDENNKVLDSFDAFTGDYLKAEDVKSKEDPYVCVSVDSEMLNDKIKLKITVERNEVAKDFVFNKTNINIIRDLGIEKPKDMIGKIFYFDKLKVTNPQTKQPTSSLVIDRIESELKSKVEFMNKIY